MNHVAIHDNHRCSPDYTGTLIDCKFCGTEDKDTRMHTDDMGETYYCNSCRSQNRHYCRECEVVITGNADYCDECRKEILSEIYTEK